MPQPLDKASQMVWRHAQAVALSTDGIVNPMHVLHALVNAAPNIWQRLPQVDVDAIRSALPLFEPSLKEPTATNIALANSVKRVLAFSMEECVRSGNAPFSSPEEYIRAEEWVAPEHMLLGLLREGDPEAAQLLQAHGVRLDDARRNFHGQR